MSKRLIRKGVKAKQQCYNKNDEEIMTGEPFLFFSVNMPGEKDLVYICLSKEDAEQMLKEEIKRAGSLPSNYTRSERSIPYVAGGGFTHEQYREMEYFLEKIDEKNPKFAKIDADISEARHPRMYFPEKRVVKVKDEVDASNRIYQQILDNQFVSNEYVYDKNGNEIQIINKYGKYLHSPDDNTPSVEDLITGVRSYHHHGVLFRKEFPDGTTFYYSQQNGKKLDF